MNEYQTWHAELLRETRIFMNGSLLTSLVKFMLCKTVAVIKVGQNSIRVKGHFIQRSTFMQHGERGEQSDEKCYLLFFFVILCYFYPGD